MRKPLKWVFRRASWVFFWIASYFWRLVIFLMGSWKVEGRENVPRHGAFIVASNHLNFLDPPIIAAATHRRVIFMAKKEIFQWPIVGGICRLYGAIGVRRFEADLSALRRGQAVLKGGRVLGMFPEGTRAKGHGLLRPWPGAALIAMRANALIVPAAISGTDGPLWWRLLNPFARPHVTVRFGEPFRLEHTKRPTAEQISAGTHEIMRHIATMLPPQYLGDYGEALLRGETPPPESPAPQPAAADAP